MGTYPPISASIDGTSPKLLWQIALVIIYKPRSFQVKTHPAAGSVGKKVLKNPEEVMPRRFQAETHQGAGLVGKKVLKIPKKS